MMESATEHTAADYRCKDSLRVQGNSSPCPFSGQKIIEKIDMPHVEVDDDEDNERNDMGRTHDVEENAEVEIGSADVANKECD